MARLNLEGGKVPKTPAPQNADRAYDAKYDAKAAENDYWTKTVGTTGKTQGQIDAAATAAQVAASTGGTIDTKTGHVIPPKPVGTDPNANNPLYELVGGKWVLKTVAGDGSPTGSPGKAWKWDGSRWVQPTKPDDGSDYDWDNDTGWKLKNSNLVVPEGPTAETKNAFANLENILNQYRLGTLASTLKKLMEKGYTSADAYNKIKYDNSVDPDTGLAWNGAYTKRFAGNAKLVAKGKNAITEEAYLRLEDSMSQTLFTYGRNRVLSADREANEAKISEWIGNNWNADDFDKLIKDVHTRVETADPEILKQMTTYYPGIDKEDLFDYFLNPKEGLASMNRKITMGEVGAAFGAQKLDSSFANIGGLVDYGVDREAAVRGASNIAEVLPDTGKLANIYGETKIKYDQTTAQDEFLKDDASARKKRNLLASAERGSFAGNAGNLTSTKISTAGLL